MSVIHTTLDWIPTESGELPRMQYVPTTQLQPIPQETGWSVQVLIAYTKDGEPVVRPGCVSLRNWMDGFKIGEWNYPAHDQKYNRGDTAVYGPVTHFAYYPAHPTA